MRFRLWILSALVVAIAGCGTAPQQAVQPLSGTARVELGQGTDASGASPTVQALSPQLPPSGPDGGPL